MNSDLLYQYAGSATEDMLLAQLWAQMQQDGALEAIFNDADFPLGELIAMFRHPNSMLYKVDEAGIWFIVWVTPVLGGAFQSGYLRPDCRGRETREANLVALRQVLERFLGIYRVLMVVTQQERLLPNLERLGYTVLGKIPHLFHGNDAWIGYMTSESLQERMNGSTGREDNRGSAQDSALA